MRIRRELRIALLLGAVSGVTYWVAESLIMTYVFREDTLVRELLSPNPHELWMRLTATAILAVLVAYGRYAVVNRHRLTFEREKARLEANTLRGLIPICAWCGKLRDDQGYWESVETYVTQRSTAEFTHGICPECMSKQLVKRDDGENAPRMPD
ncbi:MAG: hypothetical protein V3R87_00035 [Dehalococcoidia bacterium]